MEKVRRILVPLAFSPYSQGIIDYGVMLATALDVDKLIFASIINIRDVEAVETIASFGYKVNEHDYIESIQEQREALMQKMLTGHDFPEDRVKLVMKVGKPADRLLQLALKEEVDMIIMGVKAKSEIVHAFTGSVAERLFRRSPITIVSYRDEKIAAPLRERILRHQ
ncbi:MAG: universal stress protein [Desulfobulbaceae bacterium]|uniref:Universal stress protein n=1 Tax=Candidatus Desulfatifera sulfidica TaxID=2841691 RepID=A0A8J6N7K7_9BACT|nr:universal stress protein [Candidatus Desulfatifera sulfidica]